MCSNLFNGTFLYCNIALVTPSCPTCLSPVLDCSMKKGKGENEVVLLSLVSKVVSPPFTKTFFKGCSTNKYGKQQYML